MIWIWFRAEAKGFEPLTFDYEVNMPPLSHRLGFKLCHLLNQAIFCKLWNKSFNENPIQRWLAAFSESNFLHQRTLHFHFMGISRLGFVLSTKRFLIKIASKTWGPRKHELQLGIPIGVGTTIKVYYTTDLQAGTTGLSYKASTIVNYQLYSRQCSTQYDSRLIIYGRKGFIRLTKDDKCSVVKFKNAYIVLDSNFRVA